MGGIWKTKTVGEYLEGIGRALSPIRGAAERIRRRRTGSAVGKRAFFQAAEINRLTNSWKRQTASADAEICNELSTLRARARDLARNNDYAKKFLSMVKTNVVGAAGIQLQARPVNTNNAPGGGPKAGSIDAFAKNAIEDAWKRWGRRGVCTVDGTMSFRDCENLVAETVARDGDIAVRTVTSFDNPFGFALQIIEPEYLDESYSANLANGNKIRMGVEFDRWRRPVAYHFLTNHPGDILYASTEVTRLSRRERIPAEEIIHPFIRHRANQTRGVPWLVTPAYRLNMLGGYEEAELVASRTAAAKMGFFKSAEGDEYTGEDTTGEDDNTPIMEAEPGTFEQLPEGVDFVKWDPDHPTTAFEPFVLACLRGVASGLNVSYVSLANDLRGVSYSSIRQGTLEERDQWRALQGWMVEHFNQIVFDRWLEMALLTGAVPLPPRKIEKFKNVVWRARGWNWVDPLKEINANKIAIREGLTSPQRVVAQQGYEFAEVIEEIKEAKAMAEAAGLSIPSITGAAGKEPGGNGGGAG